MCEALNRIIQDQIEEKIRNSLQAGYDEGFGKGIKEGMQQGIQQSEHNINSLILRLAELGRTDDIIRSAADLEYQRALLREFGFIS